MASSQAAQTQPAPDESSDVDGLPAGERLSLEQMTRIMDVAAALRKERAIVEQQLNIDQIKAKLRERLLEAAKVNGDPVTPEEIDVAVEQYYDRLHEFQEPPSGFQTFLAHIWVRRGPIVTGLAIVLGALAVVWSLLAAGLLPGKARNERLAAQQREDADAQMASIEQVAASIRQVAAEPEVERDVAALVSSAGAARDEQSVQKLAEIAAKLRALQQELESEYSVVIVSNPGERSGFDRYWTDEQGTRTSGFYLIVEARDARGNPVNAPIANRETGRIEIVNRWAELAPEDVYNRLVADKQADGVLDERTFGVKRRGARQVEVTLPDADGKPLVRRGQLTSWQ